MNERDCNTIVAVVNGYVYLMSPYYTESSFATDTLIELLRMANLTLCELDRNYKFRQVSGSTGLCFSVMLKVSLPFRHESCV